MVYVRKFSPDGSQMPLVNTLKHDAEVTALKWNTITKQWVTGKAHEAYIFAQYHPQDNNVEMFGCLCYDQWASCITIVSANEI